MASKDTSGGDKARQTPPAGSQDKGPGTAEPDTGEETPRTQARTATRGGGKSAAPIEAPDVDRQVEPQGGNRRSSTNPVADATGVQSYPGEQHVRLVGENGRKVSADSLFDESGAGTLVTVKQRVFEEFTYPGTSSVSRRLRFAAGATVDRATAERVKAAVKADTDREEQPGISVPS